MKTQILIRLHSTIFLIPKNKVELYYFNERKEITFQWLIFTIILNLYKRNKKAWKELNINKDETQNGNEN